MAVVKGIAMTKNDPAVRKGRIIQVPQPSAEQREFLKGLQLRPGQYDRTLLVGGPSRVGKR